MEFTGERFLPELNGDIRLEHLHRYECCLNYTKGKRVLDIASGEGYGSYILASNAMSVIGVDISAEAVEHAKSKYDKQDNLQFFQGDAACIPLPSHSVDIVVSFETIEHHDKHEEMMLEIKRVLISGGMLILSSPNKHIYSDIVGGSHNHFHIKELYFEELSELLSRHFRYIRFYGQRVIATSLIQPQNEKNPEKRLKVFSESAEGVIRESIPENIEPMYYLTFSSNAPLPTALPASVFILESANPFWDKQREILRLEEEIRRICNYVAEVNNVLHIRDAELMKINHELIFLRRSFKGIVVDIVKRVSQKVQSKLKL